MRRRRWVLWLGLLLVLAGGGLSGGVRVTAPRGNFNKKTFNAIGYQLTEGEVEALLGLPAGDYRTGEVDGGGEYIGLSWGQSHRAVRSLSCAWIPRFSGVVKKMWP